MGNLGHFSLYMMSENRATIGDAEAQARGVDAQAVDGTERREARAEGGARHALGKPGGARHTLSTLGGSRHELGIQGHASQALGMPGDGSRAGARRPGVGAVVPSAGIAGTGANEPNFGGKQGIIFRLGNLTSFLTLDYSQHPFTFCLDSCFVRSPIS